MVRQASAHCRCCRQRSEPWRAVAEAVRWPWSKGSAHVGRGGKGHRATRTSAVGVGDGVEGRSPQREVGGRLHRGSAMSAPKGEREKAIVPSHVEGGQLNGAVNRERGEREIRPICHVNRDRGRLKPGGSRESERESWLVRAARNWAKRRWRTWSATRATRNWAKPGSVLVCDSCPELG